MLVAAATFRLLFVVDIEGSSASSPLSPSLRGWKRGVPASFRLNDGVEDVEAEAPAELLKDADKFEDERPRIEDPTAAAPRPRLMGRPAPREASGASIQAGMSAREKARKQDSQSKIQ
jgi:hypothetical protein